MYRIGNGYDVHQLVAGTSIKLAGININSEYKIQAHSDGDIILHALMDAILGALGEDDIGKHFPDTDEKYSGASSVELTENVLSIMQLKSYSIENIDITVVLEKPKLRPHIDEMKNSLSIILGIEKNRLNVKACTSEKMGFVGKCEGIECYAVCLLRKNN